MGEDRDTFAGLVWEKEIRSLGDLDVLLSHRRSVTYVLESNIVMTTS